jgi:hypothetical protein
MAACRASEQVLVGLPLYDRWKPAAGPAGAAVAVDG